MVIRRMVGIVDFEEAIPLSFVLSFVISAGRCMDIVAYNRFIAYVKPRTAWNLRPYGMHLTAVRVSPIVSILAWPVASSRQVPVSGDNTSVSGSNPVQAIPRLNGLPVLSKSQVPCD